MTANDGLGIIPSTLRSEMLSPYGGPEDKALVARFVLRWIRNNVPPGPERRWAWMEIAGSLGVIDSTELIT